MSASQASVRATLRSLSTGEVEVLGLLPYSSNYVFLARVSNDEGQTLAVYKPRRGERPLWDFPRGTLAAREVAAFLVSEAAGWHIVPPTVLRADAPLGVGSLQLYIDHDPNEHYFTLTETRLAELATFAAFDVVVNNADRKGGHVLRDPQGRLWAVDHGVCFHAQTKLRTVIWDLAEQELDEATRQALARLIEALREERGLGGELTRLLSAEESLATLRRAEELLARGALPVPETDHHLPWPLI